MSRALKTNRLWLIVMSVLAVSISLYPIGFSFIPGADGLFRSKSAALLSSTFYLTTFYIHISFGGLALLVGFSQFFKKLRARRLGLHRTLGKTYVISVLISGITGFYVAQYATGGIVSEVGFSGLAVGWLFTTILAYITIKKGRVIAHQKWMTRSYALCFAAVTLRVYLGLSAAAGISFMTAYPVISWLCWVPNLIFAEYLIRNISESKRKVK